MAINSNKRLDVNVTMTFAELALSTMSMLGTEGEHMLEKARGSYAPYRIWNRTGYPLFIWSDTEGTSANKETSAKQVAPGKTIDWRFDDWKTMREVRLWPISCDILVIASPLARFVERAQQPRSADRRKAVGASP